MAIEIFFGWIASFLCSLILLPQIIKALQTRQTNDISMFMLILSVAGNTAWVVHALINNDTPLIVGASIIIFMSIILIVFKYMFDSR